MPPEPRIGRVFLIFGLIFLLAIGFMAWYKDVIPADYYFYLSLPFG